MHHACRLQFSMFDHLRSRLVIKALQYKLQNSQSLARFQEKLITRTSKIYIHSSKVIYLFIQVK
jgi:hypothetical protein